MARAVAASSTAAETPVTTWQPSRSCTARRSVRHDSRAIRPGTAGIWTHIRRKETVGSGLTEYWPLYVISAGGGGGGSVGCCAFVAAVVNVVSLTVVRRGREA